MSFKIDKVYTRSGDEGQTGLVGGERVSKSGLQIVAMGSVDELNCALGLSAEACEQNTASYKNVFIFLQQELFDIGAEIATSKDFSYEGMWKTSEEVVSRLETMCDNYGEDLPTLESFILPGGSELAARVHMARAICRRAERDVFALSQINDINPNIPKYLNRLSDLLFVLGRAILKDQRTEPILWQKFADRTLPLKKS